MAIYEKDGQTFFDSQLLTYLSQGDNDGARSFLAGMENLRNLTNSSGKTLLHIAARYGNAVMAKYFIDIGFEVDARDNFGITPLALAVQYHQADAIAILLDANADVYNAEHRDCLLQSIHNAYMSGIEPAETHKLIHAMFSKRVCADFWKNKGTVCQRLFDGKCSLHLVVTILRSPQLTKNYIKSGFDVNAPESYSHCTALHAAVDGTDLPTLKLLLDNGADVNAFDCSKQTPLFYYNYASKDSKVKLEMLEYLITRGASFTLANDANQTPLEYLLTHGNVKTVRTVLKHHPVDLATAINFTFGKTPLHFLANNISAGIMQAALEGKKFDVNVRDQQGYSPLFVAIVKNKNLSTVEFLLDNGADVNADNNGLTPLCYSVTCAYQKGRLTKVGLEICKLLLQRGADVQHVFKMFKKKNKKKVLDPQATVFDIILANEQWEISEFLIAHLVLNDAHDEPIKDIILGKIQSNQILHDQFNICKEQIKKMKVARINDSLILFDLMTENEDSVLHYSIDFEFVSKLDELMNNILQKNSYYGHIINRRLENIVKKLKATKEFKATAISQPKCCIT